MARKDGKRERQHYVPQILLKPFSFKGKGKVPQVHVFDKKQGKSFRTGIDNILAEHRFYDVFEGSAEPAISEMEGFIAPVFKKLIENRDLNTLTSDERHWMAVFVASQHLRAKGFRLRQSDLEEAMRQKLKSTGHKIDERLEAELSLDDEQTKEFSIQFFAENLSPVSDMLLTKNWHLLETSPDNPFWIGDNPMVMYNERDLRPYGNIGFMVPGIQIYMPLSPTLTLGMWCPTIENEFEAELAKARRNLSLSQAVNVLAVRPEHVMSEEHTALLQKSIKSLEERMKANKSGLPVMCNDQNVMFYNSLQARWSDQYIISSQNNFALAERMLRESPSSKGGVRFQFG